MPHYLALLRPHFERQRPAYIYERLCLGNTTAATLSAEFGIPYIVEYNGSEISMRRSFENAGYVYEAEYLETEALAFEQATLISVVSAEIRKTLVNRGVDPAKMRKLVEEWGRMPPREQARALQDLIQGMSPRHREAIENYFRNLAQASSKR